uniref:L1 transposable element RRM domain-containing protein n=1 Tax=Micrurus lemniscatus lemniscatus TaxID=129467 RepID=A0A2D4IZ47_MICLE
MASKQQPKALLPDPAVTTIQELYQALQINFKKQSEELDEKIQKMEEKWEEKVESLAETIQQQHDAMRDDIVLAFQGIMAQIQDIDQANLQRDNKMEEIQEKIEKSDAEGVMMQYRAMECAIRIRGLKENDGEDLRQIFADALEKFLDDKDVDWAWNIDKIYRVNSWIARQRKLPRDVVIYFVTRGARNRVIQHSFQNKLKILGQEVAVLKEIPPKMLKVRKDYSFLVTELKRRQVQYRWDVPYGIIVTYKGERHRLNTVEKARDFYDKILKARQDQAAEQMQEQAQEGAMAIQEDPMQLSGEIIVLGKTQKQPKPQDQRQTRATAKRKEQEAKQSLLTYAQVFAGRKRKGWPKNA